MVLANFTFSIYFLWSFLVVSVLLESHPYHPGKVPTGNLKRANRREFNKRMIYKIVGRVRGHEHRKV